MGSSHRNMAAIVALVTLLTCLGLLWKQSVGAEPPRIIDGSNVTFLYQITVPGEGGFELRDLGQFVQGRHQLLPALEREVTGMKTGDEKRVELAPEEGFGPYDVQKKKTIPRRDVPAETKEGDVIEDRTGQEATVTQLSDSSAVVDYNHPLAGKPVVVKIKILRVDDPS
ncbi:MAG TPA: FKBP-type peptidyl-prolyl cis-trans isomerase [Nitrospiraceae bacterium]|nr:FKBP-type peptidyl-prolyl cis-trans isomerase [Nitrospiraceae bacterium]